MPTLGDIKGFDDFTRLISVPIDLVTIFTPYRVQREIVIRAVESIRDRRPQFQRDRGCSQYLLGLFPVNCAGNRINLVNFL